jgi:hypothetical protein
MNAKKYCENLIIKYEATQKEAYKNTSIYLSRSFTPVTFNAFNFSTRVDSFEELWKFSDSQQEFRTEYYGNILIKYFTLKEINRLHRISLFFGQSQRVFNRRTNPVGFNHQLSSIPTMRILASLQEKIQRKLEVLEIGGGSGMLGHMCFDEGFNYTNFEITQSFYIFNSTFYSSMYGDKFIDLYDLAAEDVQSKYSKDIKMLPWWHFVNTKIPLPTFDVVVMNHCFMEISSKALKFILTRLSDASNDRVTLIVSGWGATKHTEINKELLCQLENEFDFRMEAIDGNSMYFPNGTVLVSFIKNKKQTIDFFKVPIEDRFSKLSPNNYLPLKIINFLKANLPTSIKKFLKANLLTSIYNNNNNNNILLKTIPLIKISAKKQFIYDKNFEDIKNVISSLEETFGKPIYTEDEALGFYINSKAHA